MNIVNQNCQLIKVLLSYQMSPDHPFGIRIVDSYDDNSVLLELSAYNEDDRSAFLNELAEVTWVYRALENDRIGTLGVSDKIGQSTLSLHVSTYFTSG